MRHSMARGAMAALVSLLAAGLASPAESPEDAAQAAAESWLELVDAGQYGESWEHAAALFKNAVTRDQWTQAVSGVRGPLGGLVSRKVKSRQYVEHLPGAPDGQYVILQYETVFRNKASATETITPMVDGDRAWRVSGYFIR